ncbi:hypothetical protein DPMN_120163 [Dreissena polymorpha]|nr:hypothetical protein DPMN_120163 [Dreissena polymorpha]
MLRHYGYSESMGSVEKRSLLSLSEFRELYDAKWPVIVTDIIPFWEAYRTWNKEFFLTHYGSQNVLMRTVKGRLNESVAQVKPLSDFVRLLDQTTDPTSWVYLEDELFLIQNPRLRAFVGSNYLLDENMFSLFPPEIRPWDSMLLWGGQHSRSFLHMDPYNWTAVNAVLWGAKHWK